MRALLEELIAPDVSTGYTRKGIFEHAVAYS